MLAKAPSPLVDSSAKEGSLLGLIGDSVLPEGQVICMSRQGSFVDALAKGAEALALPF